MSNFRIFTRLNSKCTFLAITLLHLLPDVRNKSAKTYLSHYNCTLVYKRWVLTPFPTARDSSQFPKPSSVGCKTGSLTGRFVPLLSRAAHRPTPFYLCSHPVAVGAVQAGRIPLQSRSNGRDGPIWMNLVSKPESLYKPSGVAMQSCLILQARIYFTKDPIFLDRSDLEYPEYIVLPCIQLHFLMLEVWLDETLVAQSKDQCNLRRIFTQYEHKT